MIVGVILLRTESQFNGWRGQAKGRKRPVPVERCLALVLRLVRRSLGEVGSFSEGGCEAVGVATLKRRQACEDVVSSNYFMKAALSLRSI